MRRIRAGSGWRHEQRFDLVVTVGSKLRTRRVGGADKQGDLPVLAPMAIADEPKQSGHGDERSPAAKAGGEERSALQRYPTDDGVRQIWVGEREVG